MADQTAETSLMTGQVEALVATVYETERPLAGLAGLLDWRFRGAISKCLRIGAITGQAGECVYFPFLKNGRFYRIILAGAGKSASSGAREKLPEETFQALHKNLCGLKLKSVGISRKDFGSPTDDFIVRHLKLPKATELRIDL